MHVKNMTSSRGNKVPNQFIIDDDGIEYFQSYDTIIAERLINPGPDDYKVRLDADKWDYSVTTGRYRNQFLSESKRETEAKIKSGEYILTNLNNG